MEKEELRTGGGPEDRPEGAGHEIERRTYNYLRLAMVGMIVALGVALGVEWAGANCLQTSISAYYYTPVQFVFVGTLIALCLGMLAIYSRNPVEDAAFNVAGLLAPIVAFVPTDEVRRCSVVDATGDKIGEGTQAEQNAPEVAEGARQAIENNMWALFIVVLAGLVLMAILRIVSAARNRKSRSAVLSKPYPLLSWFLALGAWGAGLIWFLSSDTGFYAHAHVVAAVLFFFFVIVVVFASAYDHAGVGRKEGTNAETKKVEVAEEIRRTSRTRKRPKAKRGRLVAILRDQYGLVGVAMIISVALFAGVRLLTSGDYWVREYSVLLIEAALIGLFGLFWVLQTIDHWAGIDVRKETR